jgi:hypothetical protein
MSDNPYDKNGISKLSKTNNWIKACEIIGTAISISILGIIKYSKIIFNIIRNRIQK